ncbi:CHASE domain-containing protein [Paenibacillus sp. P26]|nr:CHASE domain-containing protein [Paenibacillus sp. P26]
MENTDSLGPGLDRYLDTLLKDKSGVINVAVYPQGVVQYVYPKEGNENVMGYDVMLDPRPDVQEVITRTIASKKMTINGPLEPLQGRWGLVARIALFREGQMYSLVGMALDLPALLSESTFSMPGKKITLAIRKPYQPTFYGPDEVFQGRHALAVIQPPDGIWEAGAQPDPAELQSIYKNIWSLRG